MDKIINIFVKFYNSKMFTVCIYILLFILLGFILRTLYNRICHAILPRIRYERRFSEKGVYQDDEVELVEIIYNPTPFPLFFADVEGYIYNELIVKEFVFDSKKGMQFFKSRFKLIMPYMRIKRRHTVKCTKRGFYKLETVQLFLARSEKYVDCPAEIYVYPPLIDSEYDCSPVSFTQGELESRRWLMKDPFSLSGIRDYTYGDPFSSINFKATAKCSGFLTSKIKVNEKDFCSNRNIIILINYSVEPENPIQTHIFDSIQELALGKACYLMRRAFDNNYRCGFGANCMTVDGNTFVEFPMATGETHFISMLRELSCVRNTPGISFSGMLDKLIYGGITDTEFYVFTPYLDYELDMRLKNLEYRGNAVALFIADRDNTENK